MGMAVVASPSKEKAESTVDSDASSSVHSGADPTDRRDLDFLNQGLSTRSEEYRLLFRLPNDEVLLQDFNCALQENILLQGHMYLFLRHICFYSNIFGFETKKTIPLNEITCVRKAKTAAIFPNAIEIVAGGKKHFFGSFLSRDEAYRMITEGWAQHNPDARAFLDRQDSKSGNSSDENVNILSEGAKDSKEEDDPSPSNRHMEANLLDSKSLANGTTSTTTTTTTTTTTNNNNDINISKQYSEIRENGNGEVVISTSPIGWQPEDVDAPSVPECYTMVAEAKFPIGVEDFFKLFVSDDSSSFFDDFRKRCGDKEFRVSPWVKHEQFGHTRDVSFLHPIKIYLGAKYGSTKEVQKLHVYRNNHLVVETLQTISDAPFGDHFTVEGRWDVEQDSVEGKACTLRVFLYVAFSKRTIFKGKIEQATKDECKEVFALWIKMANEILNKKTADESKGYDNEQTTCGARVDTNQLEVSLTKCENNSQIINPTVNGPRDIPYSRSIITQHTESIKQESTDKSSFLISTGFIKGLWANFLSFTRASNFPSMVLLVGIVAIIILMQVTIILLLTRSPKIYMVTDGNYINNIGSYSKESTEWIEKRFNYLKQEMHMVESHMERLHNEFVWLKSHLETLERFKDKS